MRPVVPEETKRTPRDAALILSVRERSSRHKRQRCELQGQTHGIEVRAAVVRSTRIQRNRVAVQERFTRWFRLNANVASVALTTLGARFGRSGRSLHA